MATVTDRQEIAVDSIQPKDLSYILPKLKERRESKYQSMSNKTAGTWCSKFKQKSLVKCLVISLLVLAAIIAYSVTQAKQERTLESLATATSEKQSGDYPGYEIALEAKQLYQHCKGPLLKQAFPDIDYALFGYNILRGFPLNVGHDPGFTFPIFKADYSEEHLSADCRFFIPNGFVIAPDVSCVISLSSTTVQTAYEYSKALGVYVSIEGGYSPGPSQAVKGVVKAAEGALGAIGGKIGGKIGELINPWGVSFSASVGYRQSSTVMNSGQSVFILSTAKCNYYFSKLIPEKVPKFDDAFITWIHKLNEADGDPEVYFNFFNTYGTHFPTEVTFGARYTFERKMTSKYYESLREQGIDVGLTASYAGKFDLSGETKISDAKQKRVSEFTESVETRIIPVGASPPADGNAVAWASEVKENPIPSSYKLSSIENLFTNRYMKNLNVNYDKIHDHIISFKSEYCSFLRNAGEIESCENLVPGTVLENTRLIGHYRETAVPTLTNCIETCLQDIHCVAITFCTSCLSSDAGYKTCYLLKEADESTTAIKTTEPETVWQTHIFHEKMKTPFRLSNVSITGVLRVFEHEINRSPANVSECRELCIVDAYCSAFSFYQDSNQNRKCKMYKKEFITGLQAVSGEDTYFLPARTDGLSQPTQPTTRSKL